MQETENKKPLALTSASRRHFNSGLGGVSVGLSLTACGSGVDSTRVTKPDIDPSIRFQSFYVEMRDGVRIAIDIWMPEYKKGTPLPSLLRATRYLRAFSISSSLISGNSNFTEAELFNKNGYVYAIVDARGSGASFGFRSSELSADELLDYDEIITWFGTQKWSNGRVGSFGISYDGDASELMASVQNKYLTAVAPLFNDFDPYRQFIFPGGVSLSAVSTWVELTQILDGVVSAPAGSNLPMVLPVAGPQGEALLAAARKEHAKSFNLTQALAKNEFRDSTFHVNIAVPTFKQKIEFSTVAIFIQAGWQDAGTVAGTLERFSTFSNSQEVWIGPWAHGGEPAIDPLAKNFLPTYAGLDRDSQTKRLLEFFDKHVKNKSVSNAHKTLNYATFGANGWKATLNWPVPNVQNLVLQITGAGLTDKSPTALENLIVPSAPHSSGTGSRWRSNLGSDPLDYSSWSKSASQRRSFKLAALDKKLILLGFPVISVYVKSAEPDGVLFAYLEAILPDQSIVYLTEGLIRLSSRGLVQPAIRTDQRLARSFAASDSKPMTAGNQELIVFEMFPLSAQLPEGSCLQLSFATSDFDNFKSYGSTAITIVSSPTQKSLITLPVIPS